MMEPQIVVGISGADRQYPLIWAIEESVRWRGDLTIVHCLENRIEIEVPIPSTEEIEKAQAILDSAVSVARHHGIEPTSRLCDGFPGEALVEWSKGAQLLVIGSTSRSMMSRVMHESIANYCVRHVQCPVAILPNLQ